MINKEHFLDYVIRPTILTLGIGGQSAEILLLGTALVESNLSALKQYNNGPALGIYQMEAKTHFDIWYNYLRYREELARKIEKFIVPGLLGPEQLIGNLYYATAMTRTHYRRVKQALPLVNDLKGMAQYHKDHYNTSAGKTDPEESIKYFKTASETVLSR